MNSSYHYDDIHQTHINRISGGGLPRHGFKSGTWGKLVPGLVYYATCFGKCCTKLPVLVLLGVFAFEGADAVAQCLANYRLRAKSGWLPDLEIKFYGNTALPIYLCIICNCFHMMKVKLSLGTETILLTKTKTFYQFFFTEKVCLPLLQHLSPGLCVTSGECSSMPGKP